jgi:hypothetical protein
VSKLTRRNKMIDKDSGGGCGRGDNKGMVDFGVEGIWSGGGRWEAEILVGFKKLLDFASVRAGC